MKPAQTIVHSCPFCDTIPSLINTPGNKMRKWKIECFPCSRSGRRVEAYGMTQDSLLEHWNKRRPS